MSSSSATAAPTRSGSLARALLLGGSAICGAVVAVDPVSARSFNVLPTQGTVDLAVAATGQLNAKTLQAGAVTPGTVAYASTGASATVSLSAPRTLIDWTTFHVGAGNSLAFQFGASASDIVINRVNTGAINVDAGGSVSGAFAGSTAGNIWFLAPNGVFINGTVTASGVLTSNNVGLADLNLLSDNVAALKGEISAAGALIDLTGVDTTATGVAIDASGDIVLNGDINTGAGAVDLLAKGTIAQTSGVITAGSLSGSSAGGASLTDANQFDNLTGFVNTGSGAVSVTDARSTGLLVSGTLTTVPSENLTLSSTGGPVVLDTPLLIGGGGTLVLSAASLLEINVPIVVNGAGTVALNYNSDLAGTFIINNRQSNGQVIFQNSDGTPATSSQGGQLTINNQNYTLLYQLANSGSTGPDNGTNDIAGIDANAAAGGDAGFYALATTVAGTGSSAVPQFQSALVGSSGGGFTGVFEGLGNSVANLSIGDAVSGHNVGLFATNSGTVRDLAINSSSVSGGANSAVGMLVGQNFGAIVLASVNDGSVADGFRGALVGGLVGVNGANAVIGASAVTGTINGGVDAGGLVGVNQGLVSLSTANVRIVGDATGVDLGGLAGLNTGDISQSAAAGSVVGGASVGGGVAVGGLVGSNTGSVTQSLAAVIVDGGANTAYAGGLVGYNNGVVDQAGAQGAVTAPSGAIGGLIGFKDTSSSVSEVYALGAVTGATSTSNLGPLVGLDSSVSGSGAPITFGYYDVQTTGLASGVGVGLTTAQLQGALPTGFNTLGPAWSTGPGLYPFITALYPNGVQGVSGTVYADNGFTPLSSGVNGAVVVHITVNGDESYATTAGANGYYFGFVGTNKFSVGPGSDVLAWTLANTTVGTVDAASVVSARGTTTGLDIYPSVVLLPTTATSLATLQAADPLGVSQFTMTPAFVSTLPIYVRAAGSSFDVDIPLTTGRDVTFQTIAPGAAIRVDAPIILTGSSGSLTFQSADALILNADLNVPGGLINLNAGAAITQTGGVITASILIGSSTGGARLDDANLFDLLSGFANVGPGDVSITDAKSGGLIVVGLVDQGVGDALTLTASGGPLALDGPLVALGGSINLSAAGPLAVNSSITVVGAGAVSLVSTPPVLTSASFGNGGALTGGGTLTYRDDQGVVATTDQGGALSVNDAAIPIIYGGASGIMPTQGSVDLSVATTEGSLGATILSGGAPAQGAVGYNSTGSTANINLTAPRTLIDWTTFEVGSGNTLNFNFGGATSDIVVNRVTGGTIRVDQGGAVNGLFGGQRGGNLWFLADGGVFIDGTATASGVLAGNNLLLTDLSLLAQDVTSLKTSLSTGFSMIDLVGSVTATGAEIDNVGDITLTGTIDTSVAGAVNLISTGTIDELGALITTGMLTGVSRGGADLSGDNLIGTIGGFANTGVGDITIANAAPTGLTVTGTIDAGVGNSIFLSEAVGDLTLSADFNAIGGGVLLLSSGSLIQTAGVINSASLAALASGGVILNSANQFDILIAAISGTGSVSITDDKPSGLIVGGSVSAGFGSPITLTSTVGPLTIDGTLIDQAGQLTLFSASSLSINLPVLVAGAGSVALISTPAVPTGSTFNNGGALTGTGALTYTDAQGVAATSSLGGSLNINGQSVTILYSGGSRSGLLPTQDGVDLGVATSNGDLMATTLAGGAPVSSSVGYSSTGTTANLTLIAPRTLVDWTTFEVGGGDTLNFNFGGAASDIVINRVAAGTITVDASGAVNGLFQGARGGNIWFLAPGGVFLNGTVTASGVLIGNNVGLADTRLLSDPSDTLKAELVAGASLIDLSGSVTATGTAIDSVGNILLAGDVDTDSAGTVNLVSSGTVNQSAGVIITGTLTGSSIGGASLTDANRVGALAGFGNSNAGRISLVNDISLNVTGAVDNTAGVGGGAGRDIAITVTQGDLTGAGVFTAARDVAIAASGGSVSFASATAGNNLVVRAGQALTVTAGLAATGADMGTDAADSTAAGAALATARPISLFKAADPVLTGGDIDIQSGSVTLSGSTMSGPHGDVRILATSADGPLGPALNVIGSISAGADIALDATAAGSIRVRGAQIAGRDVAARSVSGGITLASVTAGDDIVLVAPGGSIVLSGALTATGSASSGIGQALFNTVSAPLDGLFTPGPQSIFIDAASYAGGVDPVTGRPSSLTASNAIGVVVADPTGLFLADARPDGGSWVSPATLNAPSVSLFESVGNLNAGDATLSSPMNTLNLYGGGRVLVTGVIAPSVDDTVNLTIGAGNSVSGQSTWAPSQIEVINDGLTAPDHGAIGSQTVSAGGVYSSTPRTFHAASLYASSDILLGTQAFIAANGSITDPSQLPLIDPNLPVPLVAANTSNAITLAVGDLSLAAGRLIVQQDSAGLMTTSGVGSYITRRLSLDSFGPSPPPAIDLFGVLVGKGSTSLITGTAAAGAGQISLSGPLSTSSYRYLYRFNTCVINSITCSGVSKASGIPLDSTSQGAPLNLGGGFVDPGDAIGVLGGFGVVSRSSSRPSVAFSWLFSDGFVRYDETDVEDPTVTGAPNEEIWRRPD